MRRARVLAPIGPLGVWGALAAMSVLLAACVPPPGPGAVLGGATAGPGGRAQYAAAGSLSADIAVTHAKTSLAAASSASPRLLPAALPAPGALPAPFALEQLKGLSAGELAALLGEPTLLRRDGPAQIWQYAGNGCVLHVFLYQDRSTFRVSYSEVRVLDPAATLAPVCAERRGTPPARPEATPAADARPPAAPPLMSAAALRSDPE